MDLKNFRVQPDAGLYEKIERRLRVRRLARVGGGVAAACVAVAAVVWSAWPAEKATPMVDPGMVAVAEKAEVAMPQEVSTVAVAETGEAVSTAVVRETPSVAVKPTVSEAVPPAPVKVASAVPVSQGEVKTAAAPVVEQAKVASVAEVVKTPATAKAEPTTVNGDVVQVAQTSTAKSKDPTSTVVHVDDLVWAPNVIAPNGDVDENRSFKLKFSSTVSEFRIAIFNRGGRQVYKSNDPTFEWDGTHDGMVMPQGAYVWIAKFRDSAGKPHQEKGTVTIIR